MRLFGLLASLSLLGLLGSGLLSESSSAFAAVVSILVFSHEGAWSTVVAFELELINLSACIDLIEFESVELSVLMLMRLLLRSSESLLLLLLGSTQ